MFISSPVSAYNEVLETLAELKQQINFLKKRIAHIEKEQVADSNKQKSSVIKKNVEVKKSNQKKTEDKQNNNVRVYATLRPTFGYIDENGESLWDVRDALSHAGFKFTNEFMPNWRAEAQGEWGIDLSNNGDFGKSRRAYVALDSPYGRVGIGKQRPPQYLLIAEYIDIFNHGSSPFAYDPESIFFVNNLITYKFKSNDFTWLAAAQFDGSNGDDGNDLFNVGLSYDKDSLHVALTYLTEDERENGIKVGENDIVGGAIAYNLTNDWYLAVGYQDKKYKHDSLFGERNGHTFDISSSYRLSEILRFKVGYFDFDDGHDYLLSRNFDGYNSTLEWLPSSDLRFHIEYLERNYDYLEDFSSWSIGFRYDFSTDWRF